MVVALDRAMAARAAAAGRGRSGRGEGELVTTTGDKSRGELLSATAAGVLGGRSEGLQTPTMAILTPLFQSLTGAEGGRRGFLENTTPEQGDVVTNNPDQHWGRGGEERALLAAVV